MGVFKMKSAEQKEMMIFIDRYLTEEDKDRICSNSPAGKVRTFPGSEMFYMYSESNRVKSFIENGHYSSVIGFGIDYLINRSFSSNWIDLATSDDAEAHARNMLLDYIDDGHVFDESQVDKIYAWLKMTPYSAMSITTPIRDKVCETVDLLWSSCVMKGREFATLSHEVANTMMGDIINHWSETVIIPHKGVGTRNLLE
jgi:hypothetical protein|tara:strand:- start:1105 stop:1701 length:597 start_codon:yes stop_codon:yes gene_type:complete